MVDCADRDFSAVAGRIAGFCEGFSAGAIHLQFVLGILHVASAAYRQERQRKSLSVITTEAL